MLVKYIAAVDVEVSDANGLSAGFGSNAQGGGIENPRRESHSEVSHFKHICINKSQEHTKINTITFSYIYVS